MRGFSDRTFWRAVELGMLIIAVVALHLGYTESDEVTVSLAIALLVMTYAHFQNSHF